MVAVVATRSRAGTPFVTPLWFVVDQGALYMTTGRETRAARNVVQHPEVTVFLGGEAGDSAPAVKLRATARCHPGFPPWRVLARLAAKYYLGPAALAVELRHARLWGLRSRYYAQVPGGAAYLRILPGAAELLPRPSPVGA